MLLTIGPPRPEQIDRVLEEGRAGSPTYAEIGASLAANLPDGYGHIRESAALGSGPAAFDRAVTGLRQWEGHRHAGITVHPRDEAPAPGATVALVIPAGFTTLTIANRVITVVDDERRFGFVYGTLPGHGEQGEEAFVINRHDDDTVTFDIVAFSRPVGVARLGTPAVRLLQLRATDRYLAGLQRFVKGESP